MIEECIAQDNNPEDDPPGPFNSEEIRTRVAQIYRQSWSKCWDKLNQTNTTIGSGTIAKTRY